MLCYWAVRKLGFSTTELSKKLGVSQPSVSISVKRGEKIAKAKQLKLMKENRKLYFYGRPQVFPSFPIFHTSFHFSIFNMVLALAG